MNKMWSRLNKESIEEIKIWRNNFIENSRKGTAFYPFSGADFTNLFNFFPDAEEYLMVALEKPGNLTDMNRLSAGQIKNSLLSLESLVSEIADRNYFTRRKMRQEFLNPHFSGTTPVLLIFMARMGNIIWDVERVTLNDEGNLIPISGSDEKTEGVRIDFFANGNGEERQLIYLSIPLDSNSMDQNTKTGKFFEKRKNLKTIMKSAEYLFQRKALDSFRQYILEKSDIIIQDDSAIPFHYFDIKVWDAKFFGSYKKSATLTGMPEISLQKDLKSGFESSSLPLNFAFGYGILKGKDRSNLILLKKR
ncbi:MAG: hypothetical protein K8R21_02940 [Leptospira sp.]|nr:hypothetical protein [Leptospira sp.]